MIPMSMPGPPLVGEPPPECAEDLKKMRWAIIALMGFSTGRLITGLGLGAMGFDMGLLNIFTCIVMGTFVLKNDPYLKGFYTLLATTICQQCADRSPGGLQCLMPFLMCSAINAGFDLLFKIAYLALMPYGFFLVGSIVAEAMCAYFAYSVQKACGGFGGGDAGATEMSGGGNYVQASDSGAAGGSGGGGAAAGDGGSSFTVFSGSGQRLGG
mmetsp:Transcript_42948/g.118780  ORF Transcript_42948/g.118780 Transcript_42948/m.118780 type:complete len:212 (-) Transcript_42948:142-777(-)